MTALNAHIERAARLLLALSEIERDRIYLKQSARQEFADCMLGIVLAVGQCDFLMARLGVGRA
jgi:hypothetical protein